MIQLTEVTHSLLPDRLKAECVERGTIEVKGKGQMLTYLMNTNAADDQSNAIEQNEYGHE